jgi:Terpene synthase family 2, C-terminal metal binding
LLDDGPFSDAVLDIVARLRPLLTPVPQRRWVEATRRWLTGTMWVKAVVRDGVSLTLNEYAALRMDSCAGAPWFGMCEISRAPEAPQREMDAPPVRASMSCAGYWSAALAYTR